MQLGLRSNLSCKTCNKIFPNPLLVNRTLAPPLTSVQKHIARGSVLTHAKRKGVKRSKTEDAPEDEAVGGASGWDAALANIPTEDEAAGTVSEEERPHGTGAKGSELTEAATDADRTSTPGGVALGSATSTSTSSIDKNTSSAAEEKKPMSTLISLAEYTMLMEAKAAREREIAAQKEREAREAAGLSALAVPDAAPLDLSRQGFQAFAMDGGEYELLVAETVDGRLVLSDSYVASNAEGGQQQFSRPTLDGEVPGEPLSFQVIPWAERGGNDILKRKPATNKVKKIYFLSLGDTVVDTDLVNPEYDLDNVFVFDGGKKSFSRSEVRVVGNLPFYEPVLRIRSSGLTLEESFLLPDPVEVSMETAENLADLSEEDLQERLEELEKSELDELDEVPDVPSVDMM